MAWKDATARALAEHGTPDTQADADGREQA
jgi:hypothetical protein